MISIGVIGIGNCGNQIAKLATEKANIDSFAINTSENDLATLPSSIPKKCVGDTEGSGKNRKDAQKFLKGSVMDLMRDEGFVKFTSDKEVICIVSSIGGGTGSGIAPIMYDVVKTAFRAVDGEEMITILIGVLPKLKEGESTQANTLSYAMEIESMLDHPTYMIYDNNNYVGVETGYHILDRINNDIVDDLMVMQCRFNSPTPYDSIDEKDMKTLLATPGRIFVTSLFDLKEKDVDTETIEDLLIQKIKTSGHAELQRDGVVLKTGLITNLNPKLNEGFDPHLEKIRDFVGEPVEEFVHTAVVTERSIKNSVHLILTGLSMITDRINRVRERLDEISGRQEEAEKVETAVTEDEIAAHDSKRTYRKKVSDGGKADLAKVFEKFNI